DHAFGEQEPGGELAVGAGGPHDDGERAAVEPDFERLFGGCAIDSLRAAPVAHARDVESPKGLRHGCHLTIERKRTYIATKTQRNIATEPPSHGARPTQIDLAQATESRRHRATRHGDTESRRRSCSLAV